jgi:hypothetical protein
MRAPPAKRNRSKEIRREREKADGSQQQVKRTTQRRIPNKRGEVFTQRKS